jgi:hypothetical protein
VGFSDQKHIRSYFALHIFCVSNSQAHKQKQHKHTTLNSNNTIFPSQTPNILSRVTNTNPTQWVPIHSWHTGIYRLLFALVHMTHPNITMLYLNYNEPLQNHHINIGIYLKLSALIADRIDINNTYNSLVLIPCLIEYVECDKHNALRCIIFISNDGSCMLRR